MCGGEGKGEEIRIDVGRCQYAKSPKADWRVTSGLGGMKETHLIELEPFLAEDFADLAGAQVGELGGDLGATLACKDHEGVHGTLGLARLVERLVEEAVIGIYRGESGSKVG